MYLVFLKVPKDGMSNSVRKEDKYFLLKRGGELFACDDLEGAIEVFTHGAKRYPTDGK